VNRNEGLAVVEGLPDVARIVSKSLAQV